MSKKRRQLNRERKRREQLQRWLPDWKKVQRFLKAHWLGLCGIVLPVLAAFVVYSLTVAEPDVRLREWVKVEETDDRLSNGISETYCKATLRFKNFSFKAGYVDRIEFNPKSLSPSISVRVLDVDRVRIGWREEKDIQVRFVLIKDVNSVVQEKDGVWTVILAIKAYDNTGKLILDRQGHLETGTLQVEVNKRSVQKIVPLNRTP